jgi:hypothetical protein
MVNLPVMVPPNEFRSVPDPIPESSKAPPPEFILPQPAQTVNS